MLFQIFKSSASFKVKDRLLIMTILNARLFSHQAAAHPNTSLASMRSEAGWAPRRKTQKKATEQGKVSKPSIDQSRAERGSKARKRRKKKPGMTRQL